ncbi:TPR end-of-group domain-containing protein [Leptospira kirschneri]|uniref:TPR end-of-group domain-containing protein n=2 Tax=Leptospira kirschneri TaxID=29507 RepID=UPI0005313DC4|nr:hypothetical protein [Leptospira kirschneri]KON75753.1 Tetratricopeptide repeat protein [Leptospira kirschneri serovar Mozdok]NDK04848.1 hypothetical protein [Leptospira kirschneri serovar Mozdok]
MIGSSYLFQNDLYNAFLNLHKSLAIDRKYSSAFYNLARAYALAGDKTKMLDCLEKAIAWSEKYQDYANLSLKDEHFKIYWDDSDSDRFWIAYRRNPVYENYINTFKIGCITRHLRLEKNYKPP